VAETSAVTDESPATPKPKTAERPVAKPTPVAEAPGPGALASWAAYEWFSPWVRSEPSLAAEDLRPYFYFAREKLDPLAGVSLRMSPEAQNALAKLLGPTAAERTLVLSRAAQLTPADAAGVFEALARKTRETETLAIS